MNILEIVITVSESIIQANDSAHIRTVQSIAKEYILTLTNNLLVAWNSADCWKISKACTLLYHKDMIEDEPSQILCMQLAYMYAVRSEELHKTENSHSPSQHYFEAIYSQIAMLSICSDIMNVIFGEVYRMKFPQEKRQVAQSLAEKILSIALYNATVKIDDAFENFNNNKIVEQICVEFEANNADCDPKQFDEVEKITAFIAKALYNTFAAQ